MGKKLSFVDVLVTKSKSMLSLALNVVKCTAKNQGRTRASLANNVLNRGRFKMSLLTVEQSERMNELYEKAIARYLDKTDFDVTQWLSDEEANEYCALLDADCGGE
jgi:hypothetical protein